MALKPLPEEMPLYIRSYETFSDEELAAALRYENSNTNCLCYGQEEVVREGFPEMTPDEFVSFFLKTHTVENDVTRIEFEYV